MVEVVDTQGEPSRPITAVDSAAESAAESVPEPRAQAQPPRLRERGETIGRYVVVDTIGQGGMGVVYAAWDPQLDRRIALKLVNLGSAWGSEGDTQRARLLREAQALARIEHPNVVKVHDVGVSGGQVFIAMEHVNGQSLRQWLRADRRSVRDVLEVFIAAGHALATAHAMELIHRDFKPDNVLVGHAGEVKVVDFGLARDSRRDDRPRAREWAETEPVIARALERAASESQGRAGATREPSGLDEIEEDFGVDSGGSNPDSGPGSFLFNPSNITMAGTVLGTPAYMAPEQHEQATVDARSDQYAFCVSLWEALYGKRPFSGRRSDVLARRKRKLQIRESSRGLRVPKQVRSVLLRGLSPRRNRRFAAMSELLTELEGSLAERRRRWLPALALAAATLVAVSVSWSVLASDDAEPCAAPVEQLAGVWDDARRAEIAAAIAASELTYASDSWARISAGLDSYAERWLAAEVTACEATHVRHEHDGVWLDRRLACLEARRRELAGLTTQLVRRDERTVEHATRAVSSLTPIDACERERSPELMPLPADSSRRLRVISALDQLAAARASVGSGQLDDGLSRARAVLERGRELDWAPLEAEALFEIGRHRADVDLDLEGELETLHQAAIAALRGGHDQLAARSWSRLARGLVRAGELEQAERWLGYADELATALALAHGHDLALTADLLHARAQLRFAEGDFAGAEQHARERVTQLREFYGEDSPHVADGLNNLGVAVYMQYRKDEAVAAYREALAILERVHGPEHPSVATMHNNIGVVSTDRHAYADALVHYRRAVEIRERVYPPDHELVLQSLVNLANVHLFSGDPIAGVAVGLKIVQRRQASAAVAVATPERRVSLVPDLLRLGRLFALAGEPRNALIVLEQALSLLDEVPDARLPPGFVPPPKGQPWPSHLDGCRVDVLAGIEDASRALGRTLDADRALARRTAIPVPQRSHPRRCLDEHNRWSTSP
ncbi:serine/threonine-protein kinase [Enhygromyxa salina]|uniref:serine/threonine-protein kinase n=1 Tax=Enhygromyxa salina TaxID=215803 RepID=UPI001FD448B8|nr:serine/threonine-protein kinase [Enhygromyxa salina]